LAFKPPPSFSGTVGESFTSWLDKLKQYLVLQGIADNNDEYKKAYLEANLSGAAHKLLFET